MGRLESLLKFEKSIVILIIILTIFLAKFPPLYNFLNTPSDLWFVGHTSWFDAWDINVYLSYIRYGQREGILLENVYTIIDHPGVFIYQFYTILGVINRILQLNHVLLFHLATVFAGVILILSCYFLTKEFIKGNLIRVLAFIVIVLGGGLGWVPFLREGLDLTGAGLTLVNALERGHDALSTGLLLFSIIFFVKFIRDKKLWKFFIAVSFGILQITINPTFVVLYAGIGFLVGLIYFLQYKRKDIFLYPIIILIFSVVYYLSVLRGLETNSGFSGVVSQSLSAIKFSNLLIGFGPLIVFIIWGLFNFMDNRREIIVIKIIFIVELLLLLSPLGFHLYFLKGLFAFGVVIVFYQLEYLNKYKNLRLYWLILIVIPALISRLFVFNVLIHPSLNNPFFFLLKQEGEGLEFLKTLPADSKVLSLYRSGNYIPAFSNNRVYLGHKYQTPNGLEKYEKAAQFYVSMNDKQRLEFLKENKIDYVHYGVEEANLRKSNNLLIVDPFKDWQIVYSNNRLIVYQVP